MGGGVECSDEVSSTLMMGGVKPGGEDEVERWLLRTWSMWPLIIGGEKGACLRICLEVKFGHVGKYPLSTASHQVEMTGLQRVACMKATCSATVVEAARAMCESWIG